MIELSAAEAAEFYKEEPLFAKIRSKICSCGAPVNWADLKSKHDQVLDDYRAQRDELLQGSK